ncbi:unnamed protein product [Moneuplotes crassus]|uniref:Uncharacterized protein n=1 Tax=Euplotes crassus TaxID=5936 RepID=A0AAD1U812_EUPCR|nr:unnamed protein product [Moneuplotes crassus]
MNHKPLTQNEPLTINPSDNNRKGNNFFKDVDKYLQSVNQKGVQIRGMTFESKGISWKGLLDYLATRNNKAGNSPHPGKNSFRIKEETKESNDSISDSNRGHRDDYEKGPGIGLTQRIENGIGGIAEEIEKSPKADFISMKNFCEDMQGDFDERLEKFPFPDSEYTNQIITPIELDRRQRRRNKMRKGDIEYWYMNQQAYLKKKARNIKVETKQKEAVKPTFSSNPGSPRAKEKQEKFYKTKGISYFSIQEMEQDPIKFMLQIKSMKQVPENLLKLKSFREHLSGVQEKLKDYLEDDDKKTNKIINDLNSGTKQLNMKLPLSIKNYTQRNLSTCSITTSKKHSKHKDFHAIGYLKTMIKKLRKSSEQRRPLGNAMSQNNLSRKKLPLRSTVRGRKVISPTPLRRKITSPDYLLSNTQVHNLIRSTSKTPSSPKGVLKNIQYQNFQVIAEKLLK